MLICLPVSSCFRLQLGRARHLLQRTRPVLLRLHQRASDAVDQSELCQREREQALEDRDQV